MIVLSCLVLCLLSQTSAKSISKNEESKQILSEYERNRTNLLKQEANYFLGGRMQLTHEEDLVNNILMKYKEEEINQAFYNVNKFNFSKHYFAYKEHIEQSKVYQIIRKMPKGAMLHVHTIFVMDGDYFLNLTYQDHLYACYNGSTLRMVFSNSLPQRPCSFNWTLMSQLRQSANNITEFDSNIKNFLTLYRDDEAEHKLDLDTIWRRFDNVYLSIRELLLYRPVREKFIYDVLQRLYDDNIMYAELRGGTHLLHELDGTKHDELYTVKLYRDVTKRFIEDHAYFVGIKLILCQYRLVDVETARKALVTASKLKMEYPQVVAGFDFVGQEDRGKPLKDFLPVLLEYKDKMPYYFHAGETNWFGIDSDENLLDAILLGSRRIGHGYALTKHPVLMSFMKKHDIAVEVNVISNAVLALVKDVRNHPLATFLSLGLPVVLSSDDPGVWGAAPLSHDFYISFVAVASKRADLRLLKQLAINSIRYSALDNRKKSKFYKLFNKQWSEFIKQVIEENSCDKRSDS